MWSVKAETLTLPTSLWWLAVVTLALMLNSASIDISPGFRPSGYFWFKSFYWFNINNTVLLLETMTIPFTQPYWVIKTSLSVCNTSEHLLSQSGVITRVNLTSSKLIRLYITCSACKLVDRVFILSMYLLVFQVVAVYGTLSDLLSLASNKLGIRACSLYNSKGGLIDDIALIR